MAHRDETIDLTTLQEVQRLLASTDFASADQLAGRSDTAQLTQLAKSMTTRPASAATLVADDNDPLPKRR